MYCYSSWSPRLSRLRLKEQSRHDLLTTGCGSLALDQNSTYYSDYPSDILVIKYLSIGRDIWARKALEIYSDPDDRAEKLLRCLPYQYSLASQYNIKEAKRRLGECITRHPDCSYAIYSILPRRVLDVQASEGIDFWSLYKTIQDAIKGTQKLGFRFLWVDALCIIQDSPEDTARETGGVGEIYKNATLTIAAGNSPNAQAGFLAEKPWVKPYKLLFLLPNGSMGKVIVLPYRNFPLCHHKIRSPLSSRGWAFQGYILATRVLFFGCGDIWWKCQRTTLEPLYSTHSWPPTDNLPNFDKHPELFGKGKTEPQVGPPKPLQISERTWHPSEKRVIWAEIIKSYSCRELGDIRVHLPALAGVAARLAALWKDKHLAGLWESFLLQQLSWYKTRPDDLSPNQTYLAPSWSWASVYRTVIMGEPIDFPAV
ncbi:hypothetical protein G7Y89_g5284 [Cudoniella acicularis]|uniref:Heterokaryon incompatibility domain-containing protein n=1 Tax=Cudoniella acicularis TaxID=354080 RepID=A0A8H4RMR7_9HELO|nr:hypothetical protein G7Y89_g5284 [Cudoniella acicularis]